MCLETLTSTLIIEQNQVEIDVNTQNSLLQKITNLSETGEEETSYKTAKSKLDKLYLEEVGTDRSSERPINIVTENIKKYKQEIKKIKQYETIKYDIQNKESELKRELNEEIENKKIYEQIENAIEEDKNENEKIKIKNKIIEENKIKINKLENSKNEKQKNKIKKVEIFIFFF